MLADLAEPVEVDLRREREHVQARWRSVFERLRERVVEDVALGWSWEPCDLDDLAEVPPPAGSTSCGRLTALTSVSSASQDRTIR